MRTLCYVCICYIMYIENTYIDVFCPRLCLLYLVNIFICLIGYILVQYSLKDMVRISSSENYHGIKELVLERLV